MRLSEAFKQLVALFRTPPPPPLEKMPFIYPYADDPLEKRRQIWDNLRKGILFEDTQVFIPWNTPYQTLDTLCEQQAERGDRTQWFLGRHAILDGYVAAVEVMRWLYIKPTAPFSKLEEYLGSDQEGHAKFMMLKERWTTLLGTPTRCDLELFAGYEMGSIQWKQGRVEVTLTGIEHFNLRYRLYIGILE